ncbi:unnamed protein product [Peniophora sp. CBMAI 1063]|nr:unnamed protein product [Peniophora sp. CBMAI 1063]
MPSIYLFCRRAARRSDRTDREASPLPSSSKLPSPTHIHGTVSRLASACRLPQPHHADEFDLASEFVELKPCPAEVRPHRKRSPTTTTIVLDISAANVQSSPSAQSDASSSRTETPSPKDYKPALEPYIPHMAPSVRARARVQSAPRSASLPRSSSSPRSSSIPRPPAGPRAPVRSRTSSSTHTSSPASPRISIPPVPPPVHTRASSWHMVPPVSIVPPTPADIVPTASPVSLNSPRSRLSAPGSPLRPLPVPPPSAPARTGEYFAGAQGAVMAAQGDGLQREMERERKLRNVRSAFDLGMGERERERKGRVEKTRSMPGGEPWEAPPPYEF